MKELYILIGKTFEAEKEDYLKRNYYKRPPTLSNVFYERLLLDGFQKSGGEVVFISAPEVGTFPLTCRLPRLKGKYLSSERIDTVSYFTLLGIKHFSKARAIKKKLLATIKKHKAEDLRITIVLCEAHWPYLIAAKKVQKKHDVKIMLIVPDLPKDVGKQTNFLKKEYVKASNTLISKLPDGYVLFSRQMLEEPYINKNKPYIISEGILDSDKVASRQNQAPKEDFIFYAGSVSFANGIKLLLSAYQSMPSPKSKLVIAGYGDALEFVKKQEISGVEALGLINKAEVDDLMRKASLLVSPRIPEPYCSYSFPSKVINCLAYRTPLVSFELTCYPPELAEIVCYPKEVSAEALLEAMLRCLKGEWVPNETVRDALLKRLSNVELVKKITSMTS